MAAGDEGLSCTVIYQDSLFETLGQQGVYGRGTGGEKPWAGPLLGSEHRMMTLQVL